MSITHTDKKIKGAGIKKLRCTSLFEEVKILLRGLAAGTIFDRARLEALRQRMLGGRPYCDKAVPPKANRKMEGARILGADAIVGCENCCYSCYANRLAMLSRINHLLVQRRAITGIIRHDELLRIGVTGDPASDWQWTATQVHKLLERSRAAGEQVTAQRNVCMITKLQSIRGFTADVASVANTLQVSLDPIDPVHATITMRNMLWLREHHPGLRIVVRMRTLVSTDPDMQRSLQRCIDFARRHSFPVLETRMRFFARRDFDILRLAPSAYRRIKGQYKLLSPVLRPEEWLSGTWVCDAAAQGCHKCGGCKWSTTVLPGGLKIT